MHLDTKLQSMQSHLNQGTSRFSNINNNTRQGKVMVKQIHMDVDVEEAEGEEGAGVAGEVMAEVMVGMITTKEVMVDMATKEGMATTKVGMTTREVTVTTKVDMATKEGTDTTKVAMEVDMVTTKVDMGDMKMVAGTTTRTEAVVVVAAVAEEEATGDTVDQDTSVVAELEAAQVAQAAGVMCEVVDGWVLDVGGATRTIRPSGAVLLQKREKGRVLWIGTEP